MKFVDLLLLANTDDFWITVDGDIENTVHIEGTSKEVCKEASKFFGYTVIRITPVNNAIEVELVR